MNAKRHAHWALVESCRTDRGLRQRVVAYLGQLKDAERRGVKRAAEGKRKTPYQQLRLFGHDTKPEQEWAELDTANVRVDNQLDCGGPWLAVQLLVTLQLDTLFENVTPRGEESIPWAKMAVVLTISRLCNPSREPLIAKHYYRSTAMPVLLGVPADKVNQQRLYLALDRLLPRKETLEKHLKDRLGGLSDLEYDLLLYGVTSRYFEGQCEANPMAQRGYSQDNRSDCKRVCVGLVVSKCGMPLGYELFEGNRNDVKTWRDIVTNNRYSCWRDSSSLANLTCSRLAVSAVCRRVFRSSFAGSCGRLLSRVGRRYRSTLRPTTTRNLLRAPGAIGNRALPCGPRLTPRPRSRDVSTRLV